MSHAPARIRDPIGWCLLLTLVFALLAANRLLIPDKIFFDETHYVAAARTLLTLAEPVNMEHPMLGKELIALGILIFGDGPLGWRIFPYLLGLLTIYAGMRAMWHATCSRGATALFGVLLITGFGVLVHTRIAMLDIFMLGFFTAGMWQWIAAIREPERARIRLAAAGVLLGCSMASKWTILLLAALPGIAFLVLRARAAGGAFLWSRRGSPVPGITLIEAGLWLGVVPLAVYFASFFPYLLYENGARDIGGLFALQLEMLDLQTQVLDPHPYQSELRHWIINIGAIWYFYEDWQGAWRGVIFIGNPISMLLGIPAVIWAVWTGMTRERWDALSCAGFYLANLMFWFVSAKPVQFYYHYLPATMFLLAALAMMLDEGWRAGRWWRSISFVAIGGIVAIFCYFYPILSAARLAGERSFLDYAWLDAWL